MKKIALLFCLSTPFIHAQTIAPSQIKPGTNGQIVTTVGGKTAWGNPAAGGVASFNGRTSIVVPLTGDYICSQVTGSICSLPSLFNQTIQQSGAALTQRAALNFIPGSSGSVTCADNPVTLATDCTFTGGTTGGLTYSIADVTGSRSVGVVYQNTTDAPMFIGGSIGTSGSGTGNISVAQGPSAFSLPDVSWANQATATVNSGDAGFSATIMPGYYYIVQVTGAINLGVRHWTQITSTGSGGGGGSMVYPAAGIPISTGTAWGSSLPVPPGGTTNFLRADGTWAAPAGGGGGCALGTCVQNSASVDQNVVQASGSALNVTHLGITNNELLNAKSSNFISNGASEDTLVNGGEPEKLADLLQVPTGSRTINAISSASLVDMLTCSNASCSHTATNGQDGTLPVSFPLGVTSNTKSQLGFGFNDLSNMGGSPTAANLDYFHGQELAWGIMFATPDTLKLSTSASCTFTGTWIPVTGSIWPAGAMKATTDAATATCVLPPATDAGIISYKNTGSDGVWSGTVTEAGVTHNITDSYLNTTSIAQNSGTYISAWGGNYDLWAIGVSGLPGGTPTVVMTCTHAGADGCLFVAPYAMAPSGTLHNSPALLIKLTLLQCNNGTCSGAISGHSDAQINLIRNEQLKAANELRANGLNVTAFDGDAAPQGMNPNNVADTGRVPIFTVSAGGTGYSNGNLTFSGGGCTVLPTAAAVPLSGGVLTAGTYFVTSPGACTSAPTIAFSGGGTGAAGAATYVNDVHPNVVGAAKIAAAGFTSLNGALNASDKFSPRSTSNCDLAAGANSEFCVSIPSNQMNMLGAYLGFGLGANSGTFAMNRIPSTGAIYDSTQGAFQLQHVVGSTTPASDTWAIESYPSTGGFVAAGLPLGWNGLGQVTVGNPGFLLNFCGTAYFNIANCTWVWNNGGGMTSAGVTGGDMGAHTINVHAIYQDGVAVGSGGGSTNTQTAGASGVTANQFVSPDTSNPIKFNTSGTGSCGVGVSGTTAAAGATFTLSGYDTNNGTVTVTADAGGMVAGHLVLGSTVTGGKAMDAGTTSSLAISELTPVCGQALTSAAAGATFTMLPRSRGIFGHQIDNLNGTLLSGLATGILKNTTATGVPSIAIAADFPTLNQNTTGTASNLSGTPALPNGTTATTQTLGDNTTKIATDAFVLANAGGLTNPMSGVGDAIYGGSSGTPTRLAGPTTTGQTFVYAWQPSGSPIAPTALNLGTYLASPPAIGGTAPAAGAFTTDTANQLIGSGSAPTAAAGTGLGTSPTCCTFAGTDLAGTVTFTTGTTPTAAGIAFTTTFNTTKATAPKAVILYPGNSNAGLVSVAKTFTSTYTTTGWVMTLSAGSTLTASVQYIYNYLVIW